MNIKDDLLKLIKMRQQEVSNYQKDLDLHTSRLKQLEQFDSRLPELLNKIDFNGDQLDYYEWHFSRLKMLNDFINVVRFEAKLEALSDLPNEK